MTNVGWKMFLPTLQEMAMATRKDQHTVGVRAKPRGQQMGFAGNPDQNRQAEKETPSRLGKRPRSNKLAADRSAQNVGSDSVTPRTTSPSTPAMTAGAKGDTGGEKVFKRRLARKRVTK